MRNYPVLLVLTALRLLASDPAIVLTNHLGYDAQLPKRAIVRGSAADGFETVRLKAYPAGNIVWEGPAPSAGPVDKWRDWHFWTVSFDEMRIEGEYTLEVRSPTKTIESCPFRVQKDVFERHTLSDVLFYFKGQRCSGALDRADRTLPFLSGRAGTVDVHGGWYDASGDYGKHLSHLSYSTYHNPQQTPLVVYSLLRSLDLLDQRNDENFAQYRRRLLDEALYGADFLVRMRNPSGSFFRSVSGRGAGKKPEDRRIAPAQGKGFTIKTRKPVESSADSAAIPSGEPETELYDVGFRSGGGLSIAALAMASRLPADGEFAPARYLGEAEAAYRYLDTHNPETANDGKENIVDDVCALLAATELHRATAKTEYASAARKRADNLLARLISRGDRGAYFRADDKDRPFFHAADAGLPIVSLLAYHEVAPDEAKATLLAGIRRALAFELATTREVTNPFGLARQYVQNKAGERRTAFFYPHDSDTAPWWQGENARLASLAAAARLALPRFKEDAAFSRDLRVYATDQLNWILGLNPFDTCMLQGTGRNNPEYYFFGSYQYRNAPGGICNGITAGLKNPHDIDFNLTHAQTGLDHDWRWGEQWLPHGAWYLLAVAAGSR